jgi:GTP-binding protein
MIDSKEGVTDQDCHLGGLIHEKGKGCIILMNKWDLIEKSSHSMDEYESVVYNRLKYLSYAPILFISALTGQRVNKILDLVDRVVDESRKRISTSQLNKTFQEWVETHPPPLYKNRIVKLNYITQVSTAPPTFVIYSNIPEGIHLSYERFLINKIRENYGFEGVPIRLRYRKKRRG